MKRLLYLLPLALFLVLAGYFLISLRPNHDIHELPSAMIDKPAPAFDLASLDMGSPEAGASGEKVSSAGVPTTGAQDAGASTAGALAAGSPPAGDPAAGGPAAGDRAAGGPATGGPTTGGPGTGGPIAGGSGVSDQSESKSLTLEALKGHPFVINFFASWCVPCRIEHPLLMRLAQQNHIPLYGIAYKDKPSDSARLLATYGDPYRQIGVDRDGRVGLDFGVYGVPETYVIDSTGRIRRRFVGPLTAETADKELLPLLKQLDKS